MYTRNPSNLFYILILLSCLLIRPCIAIAGDWPQWRGVDRNGKSDETGLLSSWPDAGPRLLWKASGAGTGYSSLAVSAGRVFTMGKHGDDEFVLAFSVEDGKLLWRLRSGGAFHDGRGSGPRATPTVHGDKVYAVGPKGDLTCATISGEIVWQVNILQRFVGGYKKSHGICESVLIEGNKVICSPGGEDHCVVALDRFTGSTIWTSKGLSDSTSYASAVAMTVGGVRQIVHFVGASAAGIRADDGLLMWQNTSSVNTNGNHAATPVVRDNHVFVTSGYGAGCALVELSSEGGRTNAKEVYFNKVMKNHHGGVVLVDGYIYGYSNKMVCMDFLTGERKWRVDGPGKCSLIYADGHLYCLSQDGVMALVEANPDSYVERGRFIFRTFDHFKIGGFDEEDEKPTWARPVIANGKLLLRDQDNLYCYDIKDSAGKTSRR